MKEDEVDFESRTIDQKIGSSLTLIALPKWRQGMRLSRTAHPVVLNDASSIARLQNQFSVKTGPLAPTGRDFETFDYRTTTGEMLTAMIYAPQLVGAGECTPIIGDRDHMLLGTCNAGHPSAPGTLVYVLSDPDLINNHGLALGDNAGIAADLFADLANDGRVLVDYSTNHWTCLLYTSDAADDLTRVCLCCRRGAKNTNNRKTAAYEVERDTEAATQTESQQLHEIYP